MRPIDADAISVKSEIESVREVVEIILDEAPTLNAIVIPENPTNGDVIEALFPNMVDSCWEYKKYLSDICGDYTAIEYTKSWWNAPYKGVQS